MSKRILAMVTLGPAVTLGLSGCGSSGFGSSGFGSSGSNTNGSTTAKGSTTIKVAETALGKVLVDGGGRTLYFYTPDGANAGTSKCLGGCARLWPAMTGKPTSGSGVDASLISVASGSKQASYAGHLLYYYAQDSAAGDVNGQGVDGIWFVLDSKGTLVEKAASSSSDTSGG